MKGIPKCLASISPNWHEILSKFGFDEMVGKAYMRSNHKQVEQHDFSTEDVFDINDNTCCIVGEAHRLTADYCIDSEDETEECDECHDMSMRLYRVFQQDYINPAHPDGEEETDFTRGHNEETLVTNIKEFCEHIKDVHPELIDEECN